jgi:hypothetical protein
MVALARQQTHNAYIQNVSNEVFLESAFTLIRKKLNSIYELCLQEQTAKVFKERYEKTSQVLEALNLMQISLDKSAEGYEDLLELYTLLQKLVFEGNNSDPELLLKVSKMLP